MGLVAHLGAMLGHLGTILRQLGDKMEPKSAKMSQDSAQERQDVILMDFRSLCGGATHGISLDSFKNIHTSTLIHTSTVQLQNYSCVSIQTNTPYGLRHGGGYSLNMLYFSTCTVSVSDSMSGLAAYGPKAGFKVKASFAMPDIVYFSVSTTLEHFLSKSHFWGKTKHLPQASRTSKCILQLKKAPVATRGWTKIS